MTANYVNTHNQFQAFGEQNDYGIMGSLFFAPTSVDFRPVNGIYPLPPSLGTNPLLAIDRIRNPQTIDRFIGSAQAHVDADHERCCSTTRSASTTPASSSGSSCRAAPCSARRRSPPAARSRSSRARASSTRTAWRRYTVDADRAVRAAHDGRRQLHVAARPHDATPSANGLAPVGELVSAGSVFTAGADRRRAPHARLLRAAGGGVARPALPDRRRALRRVVHVRAVGALAGVPEAVGVVRRARTSQAAGCSTACASAQRARLGGQPAGHRQRLLAVHQLHAAAVRRRPGFVNDITFGNPTLRNERAREWEVGAELGLLERARGARGDVLRPLVSDLLFFRPLPTSTGFSRQFAPIGSMSNKGLELLLRTTNVDAPNFQWTSTVTYTQQQEQRREPRRSRTSSRPAATRTASARVSRPASFYGSYAARNCLTGALLLDSLGRYRRSNQTVDMGATLRGASGAVSGGTCNDSLNTVHRRPESGLDRLAAQRVHDRARSCASARCSTACSATTS